MVIQKRCLLWDWTNTNGVPAAMDEAHFGGPMKSVSNWNTVRNISELLLLL